MDEGFKTGSITDPGAYERKDARELAADNEGIARALAPSQRAASACGEFVPGRVGDWIQARSRTKIFVLDMRPEDVLIEDIAHALANQCRYGGHCKSFLSVAEHSILVSYLVPKEFALAGLLHDAEEAYLQDLPRPIKHMPEFAIFRDVSRRVEEVILTKFGCPCPLPAEVKKADNVALSLEIKQLMDGRVDTDWSRWLVDDLPEIWLSCMPSGIAKRPFLERFYELTGLPKPAGWFAQRPPYEWFSGLEEHLNR